MIKNWTINVILLVAMVGILDSGYLTLSHFSSGSVGCFLLEGCDVVLKSSYASIFSIPVALLGLIYYLSIFIGAFIYNFNKNKILMKSLIGLISLGLISTFWLLYLQAFILQAFCIYCLISAITSIFLFGLGMYSLKSFL